MSLPRLFILTSLFGAIVASYLAILLNAIVYNPLIGG